MINVDSEFLVCYIPLARYALLLFLPCSDCSRAKGWSHSLHRPLVYIQTAACIAIAPHRLACLVQGGEPKHCNNGAGRGRRLAKIHGPAAAATAAETATAAEPPVSETARRLPQAPLRVRTTIIITEHAPRLDALARERARRSKVGPDPAAAGLAGAEPVAAAVDAVGTGRLRALLRALPPRPR